MHHFLEAGLDLTADRAALEAFSQAAANLYKNAGKALNPGATGLGGGNLSFSFLQVQSAEFISFCLDSKYSGLDMLPGSVGRSVGHAN